MKSEPRVNIILTENQSMRFTYGVFVFAWKKISQREESKTGERALSTAVHTFSRVIGAGRVTCPQQCVTRFEVRTSSTVEGSDGARSVRK